MTTPVSIDQLTAWANSCLHMNHLGTLVQREIAAADLDRALNLTERARRRAWLMLNELFGAGAVKPEGYAEPGSSGDDSFGEILEVEASLKGDSMDDENRYSISLRVRHPTLDPAEVTSALDLSPNRSWSAGQPRTTPAGETLGEINSHTYWTARLIEGNSIDRNLSAAIAQALDLVAGKEAFFVDLASTGGKAELFVGWFFDDGNSGDVLDHQLLGRLAHLSISLSLDIYP